MSTSTIARVDRTLMGVKCTVTVVGHSSAVIAQRCLDSVATLERLWSRFLQTSDISRLNNANGEPVWVHEKTTELVAYLRAAHVETKGLFNPTLLPLQLADGDSRSLINSGITTVSSSAQAQSTMSNVRILDDGRVQLFEGATLDSGGLAKGFAADLVVAEALSMGATGACVNIGGDMAIHTGSDDAWPIDVMSPIDATSILDTVHISHGGVATSALNARHRNGSHVRNHLYTVDGVTQSQTVGATVLASHAAWAEAWTKFAILTEPRYALRTITEKGLAALLVLDDGTTLTTPTWKELAR